MESYLGGSKGTGDRSIPMRASTRARAGFLKMRLICEDECFHRNWLLQLSLTADSEGLKDPTADKTCGLMERDKHLSNPTPRKRLAEVESILYNAKEV
jgi:hypothetical protein